MTKRKKREREKGRSADNGFLVQGQHMMHMMCVPTSERNRCRSIRDRSNPFDSITIVPISILNIQSMRQGLIIDRLFPMVLEITHHVSTSCNADLAARMKQLNEEKRYSRVLALYESNKRTKLSHMAINQTLQACIHLGDFDRGVAIHQQLSAYARNSPHIQLSLLQLYRKWYISTRNDDILLIL